MMKQMNNTLSAVLSNALCTLPMLVHRQHPAETKQPLPVRIPPLPVEIFSVWYKSFCTENNIVHIPALMSHDGHQIDLYALHVAVVNAGFYNRVAQNDQWPVIGAKLGFVQFPASNSEPAKSGPGVAQHVEDVYEQYLSNKCRPWRKHACARRSFLYKDTNGAPNLAGALDPQQFNEILQYATVPTPELRRRNVPARIINLVEANRPLLRSLSQRELGGGVADNAQPTPQQHPMPSLYMKQQGPVVNPVMAMRSGQSQIQQDSSESAGPAMTVASVAATVPFRHRTQPVTEEELQNNLRLINSAKSQFISFVLERTPYHIPDDQKAQFNATLEELCRCAIETEPMLHIYLCYIDKKAVQRLTMMIAIAQQQRKLFASSQCVKRFQHMREMIIQMQGTSEAYAKYTPLSASSTSPSHSAAPSTDLGVAPPPSFSLPSSHTMTVPPQSPQQGLQSHPPFPMPI
ncbi:hypothetical protein SCP_1303380 [Sparassis crispa]|uniref:ARID domain-containing protein n=1 Tax=Sparassis crispa TaxID=139825 RepID=A0A401H2A5_9APHY|nr:hypothetical protein SCP_1303380 [Sparassis crispa]GBE88522.1 hypothetical protein SCP_1303380 [Sparassis crispa]